MLPANKTFKSPIDSYKKCFHERIRTNQIQSILHVYFLFNKPILPNWSVQNLIDLMKTVDEMRKKERKKNENRKPKSRIQFEIIDIEIVWWR